MSAGPESERRHLVLMQQSANLCPREQAADSLCKWVYFKKGTPQPWRHRLQTEEGVFLELKRETAGFTLEKGSHTPPPPPCT